FSPFFLLPPLRHGRRDPALADRLAQPHIAPSDHRNSFATSQLRSTRAESSPNLLPTPFPFCAAAGELRLTADRPAPKKTEHDSYPRSFLELTRCSCAPCSSTPSPPSPPAPANRTTDPPSTPTSSKPCTKHSNVDQVCVPRSLLSHAPPRGSPGKPCTAEHHRQDATAEKAGEGPGCNFFFSFKGVSASFPVYTSEILKCETNHRKIRKMQTQLIWIPCNKIYK